jgi:hypothetical protein
MTLTEMEYATNSKSPDVQIQELATSLQAQQMTTVLVTLLVV